MTNNYIVIEGLEGAGKTTASDTIIDTLKKLGVKKIIFTREPGGTLFAEKLRKLILDTQSVNNEIINNKAELLVFYAARVQLVETVIKPALVSGNWIVSDRHDLSTQAYQGGGRGINKEMLSTLRNMILGNFCPSLTLYLDVTPEIGLMRTYDRERLNRIDQESLVFFERTRARYLEIAKKDTSICVVDATKTLKVVTENIREIIIQWFQKRKT